MHMQTRSSDENSVSLSVCLSGRLSVNCELWQNGKNQSRFLYRTKEHLDYFFEEKEWLVGVTPSTWNLGQTDRFGAKSPILDLFSLLTPQP